MDPMHEYALPSKRAAPRGSRLGGPLTRLRVLLLPACGSLALAALMTLLALATAVNPARAAEVTCPNANPVVNENSCMGPGTTANQSINDHYSEELGGFTTKTSYNLGESVPLKIGTNEPSFPSSSVNIAVYRIGYYGGTGARLISAASANNVKVNNSFKCEAMNATTGELSCANWATTYTVPGSALPISGIYEAVFTDVAHGGIQNYVTFTVRNDARASQMLFILPSATYEAYNTWGCKSLYFDACGGENTISGDGRAVAVSFDRPLAEGDAQRNKFFGPDDQMVVWLEEQGYDVTYSDDIQTDQAPASLLNHKIVVISGHSEYWSHASFNNVLAARNAGVNIASFSSNTAYWQTRYSDSYRTLVCYKTIQGSADGDGGATPNDPASLGPDGIPHTADDQPQFATTTRRDPGAPAGDPNAPPGGRIGANQPENELFGSLYVGDNEEDSWGLTVAAGNPGGEYEASRVWRNAGLASISAVTIDEDIVGWEWDQVPSPTSPAYAGPAAVEPAGVKRLSLTNTSDQGSSWLQDSGRVRASTPPPGQQATSSAVEYRAPSGAYVFSAGTNQWAYGLDTDPPLNQATYNIFSEMGVQPATPEAGVVLDLPGAPKPPWAVFKASPTTVLTNQPVSFDGSASSDPSATITNYFWDLDGSGTFSTSTGSSPLLTHAFSQPGTYNVVMKVLDSLGQQDVTTRTITVNDPVTANIAASPNPASVGQAITFDASHSVDVVGPITSYRWDLDGSGNYATSTGSTPTLTTSFPSVGAHTVSVKASDAAGNSSTASITENVVSIGLSSYSDSVLATPSLLHYYRLGEQLGPTIFDSKGSANGTLTGAIYREPGAINGDPNTAVSFPGGADPTEGEAGANGTIPMDLSSQTAITVEFWLKWNTYANQDELAMELTPNSNEHAGGFLVDPNAPEFGGTFGVGIGLPAARNSVFFARPSAGVWHHYALVMDSSAPSEHEITPYVDGVPVPFQQESANTGSGPFASSTLYLFSRGANTLFGNGSMDELAIYGGALSAARIQEHFEDNGSDPRPVASMTMTPSPARPGQTVTFDASKSSYSKGTIKKYEWDLDGDGTYETTTTTPVVSKQYTTEATVNIGLRVTDSNGGWDYITKPLQVGNFAPAAKISASPSPALTGQTVTLKAAESTDQGTITDYKWDLDGSGAYATDTGATPTVSTSFQAVGVHTVGVQVTNDHGLSSKATVAVKVLEQGVSDYPDAIQRTPGLIDYYRLGEPSGPTIFDSKGSANGTISGGLFGQLGAVAGDPNTAIAFNGTSDSGTIPLNLSGTSQLTVEFWLKWNQYAGNDALAMEFTPNFNEHAGGFLVDPNAPEFGGTFGIGIGEGATRNSIFFARPSAGVWHHYALVLDSTAPAASEITPYVDGQPVPFQQESSGTGGGAFANSTLYLFSRDANALFGAGTLDELAIYNKPLSAGTIFQHYSSEGASEPPSAAFTMSPNPVRPGQSVTLDASASTGHAKIVDYRWDLDGDGTYETDAGANPKLTTSFASSGTYKVGLRVIDANNATDSTSHSLTVGNLPPVASLKAAPNPALTGQTVTFDASGSSDQGAITDYQWDLDGSGNYATDTGTKATVTSTFQTVGPHTVGVKLTNDHGLSTTTTVVLPVLAQSPSAYPEAVLGTPGLIDYYRLGEPSGPTILDSKGVSNGTLSGGAFGIPGAVAGETNTAIAFNGSSDSGAIPLDLSGTNQVTVEFWLKWNRYSNDDALAMEFTPNFNEHAGGFLVDPDASQLGGSFGIGIGPEGSRNSIFFARPSAGVWHHYALVLDSTAPGASEITPYVDGVPVSFQQEGSVTAGGPFANSTLYLFSRDGNALFGAGSLDELAIYNQPLSAATIFQHYNSNGVAGTPPPPPPPPPPPDTTPPSGGALTVNGFAASAGGSGSISTKSSFTIARTDYSEAQSEGQSGLASSTLTVIASALAKGQCGAFTAPPMTIVGAPLQTVADGCYRYTLTGTDNAGNKASITTTVMVDTTPPTGGALTVNGTAASAAGTSSFNTTGSFTIGTRTDYNADSGSGMPVTSLTRASGTLSANACANFGTPVTLAGAPAQTGLTEGCYRYTLTGTDFAGNAASLTTTVEVDKTAPLATASVPAAANGAVPVSFTASDAGSGVNAATGQLKRATGTYTLTTDTCSAFAAFANIGAAGVSSPFTDSTVGSGHCYEYEYTVSDLAGNSSTSALATVKVNTNKPTLTGIVDTTPGSTAGLPQVGDAVTLKLSDAIAATSVPSSVTLTYARAATGSTTLTIAGLSSGSWSTGDSGTSRYSKVGGTAASVTASTLVSGATIKLTVTKVTDTSKNLTAGGPAAVSGTLSPSLSDVFGNTASTASFTSASIRIF